jgi:hypothetical protein
MVRFGFLFALLISVSLRVNCQSTDFNDVDFSFADSTAARFYGAKLTHPERLADSLTRNMPTEAEKFRSIFKWIADNISYDVSLFNKDNAKEAKFKYRKKKLEHWKRKFGRKALRRTLRKKQAICWGYSMLLENMCLSAGISCKMINGYGRTSLAEIGRGRVNHAWNVVKIDGKWYPSDATWASGSVDVDLDKFYRKFRQCYFLTDPSLFIANHFPSDSIWMLLYEKPKLTEFLNAPLKTTEYLISRISHCYPEEGLLRVKKGDKIFFTFSSNHLRLDSFKPLLIVDGVKNVNEVRSPFTRDADGSFKVEQVFENKGVFNVDIFINNYLTLTYKVVVK